MAHQTIAEPKPTASSDEETTQEADQKRPKRAAGQGAYVLMCSPMQGPISGWRKTRVALPSTSPSCFSSLVLPGSLNLSSIALFGYSFSPFPPPISPPISLPSPASPALHHPSVSYAPSPIPLSSSLSSPIHTITHRTNPQPRTSGDAPSARHPLPNT